MTASVPITEDDICRRVAYDARPVIPSLSRGYVVGVGPRHVEVLFDGSKHTLNVISNLKWEEDV